MAVLALADLVAGLVCFPAIDREGAHRGVGSEITLAVGPSGSIVGGETELGIRPFHMRPGECRKCFRVKQDLLAGDYTVEFLDYDWHLNGPSPQY